MKFVDEYRDSHAVQRCAAAIRALVRRPWSIMEVCSGQTHAISVTVGAARSVGTRSCLPR